MYSLIVENEHGDQLELTNNKNYDVLEVIGTNPPPAVINTSIITGVDGSKFNSSRINQRNLVISLDIKPPIERNRLILYKYFRSKRYIKIYYITETRNVFTEGYVETFENNPFTQRQQPQISIICPNAYWRSVKEVGLNFSKVNALFEFPFSISQEGVEFSTVEKLSSSSIDVGEIETGAIITMYAESNQIINPKFQNLTTDTFFGLDINMNTGDLITINTQQGEKSVILLRNGEIINLLSNRTPGSTWLTFIPGENEVTYTADVGQENLTVNIKVLPKYEGV